MHRVSLTIYREVKKMTKIMTFEESASSGGKSAPRPDEILGMAIDIVKDDSCATQTPDVKLREVVKSIVNVIENDLFVKKE